MRRSLQIILLLKNMVTGILAPVLMLVLLAHGATLATVSLCIGIYSFTVIIAEFPSGVFADVAGRKSAFALSMMLSIVAYGLLLLAHSLVWLLVAMVLSGLARAFASGSLDALVIDGAADDAALVKITARLSMLESGGLAIGALAGGALAGSGSAYTANLLVSLGLCTLLLMLTLLTVQELPRGVAQPRGRGILGMQVRKSLHFVNSSGAARALFVLAMLTGFAMLALETYWQPALQGLNPPMWVFGVTSVLGFAGVMVGSRITEWLLHRRYSKLLGILAVAKTAYALCLPLLVLPTHAFGFVSVFMVSYAMLGSAGVAENTLLNRLVPSAQRAGILSLYSLALQLGGLAASALGFIISAGAGFRPLWYIGGGLLLVGLLFLLPMLKNDASSMATSRLGTVAENANVDAGDGCASQSIKG